MGMFDFLKKKKEEAPEDEVTKPASLEQPADYSKRPYPEALREGVSEPAFPHESDFPQETATKSFEKLSPIQSPPQQSQPQVQQETDKLIIAKLETIKAQLDFLQQKMERIEQQLQREDVVKWR